MGFCDNYIITASIRLSEKNTNILRHSTHLKRYAHDNNVVNIPHINTAAGIAGGFLLK